jgi:hypothetical protein
MTQKTNEQGQKVYEVLSEEYIRLKECELFKLKKDHWFYYVYSNIEMYTKLEKEIEELESHIEDLKAEL